MSRADVEAGVRAALEAAVRVLTNDYLVWLPFVSTTKAVNAIRALDPATIAARVAVPDVLDGREALARWMLENGFATGHGDTLQDLLAELGWQINELRARVAELEKAWAEAEYIVGKESKP